LEKMRRILLVGINAAHAGSIVPQLTNPLRA
jgi:hypothetical protein